MDKLTLKDLPPGNTIWDTMDMTGDDPVLAHDRECGAENVIRRKNNDVDRGIAHNKPHDTSNDDVTGDLDTRAKHDEIEMTENKPSLTNDTDFDNKAENTVQRKDDDFDLGAAVSKPHNTLNKTDTIREDIIIKNKDFEDKPDDYVDFGDIDKIPIRKPDSDPNKIVLKTPYGGYVTSDLDGVELTVDNDEDTGNSVENAVQRENNDLDRAVVDTLSELDKMDLTGESSEKDFSNSVENTVQRENNDLDRGAADTKPHDTSNDDVDFGDIDRFPLMVYITPYDEPGKFVIETPYGGFTTFYDMDLWSGGKLAIDRIARLKDRFLHIEGIDKIKLVLNPTYLNLHNFKRHIDPQNRLTLHKTGSLKALSIHAEYMNPLEDMFITIAKALYELIKQDVIRSSYTVTDPNQIVPFIAQNLDSYISYVQELELCFNFRLDDLSINQDSIDRRDLIRYLDKETNTFKDTYYSSDYDRGKRRSIIIVYRKDEKDFHDRHIGQQEIANNPYKQRLEFRLCRNNCKYLGLENLRGTYKDIIKRYTPLLAVIYNNYLSGHIETSGSKSEYKQFHKIEVEADKGRVRYTGNLKRSNPNP